MTVQTNPERWITYRKPKPEAQFRLFCFPYAGGTAGIYRQWPNELPGWIDVCPVQLPGREMRISETPIDDMNLLVETLAIVLRPYLNLPFAFFGHSMGSIIGFALAHYLQEQQKPAPAHLFVSARYAPHLDNHLLPIHALPQVEFLEQLENQYQKLPVEIRINQEIIDLVLPAMRADFTLHETYKYLPGNPLKCPITAFGGLQDKLVGREALEAWEAHTADNFSLHMLNGDHFFIDTPLRAQLLRAIAFDLSS